MSKLPLVIIFFSAFLQAQSSPSEVSIGTDRPAVLKKDPSVVSVVFASIQALGSSASLNAVQLDGTLTYFMPTQQPPANVSITTKGSSLCRTELQLQSGLVTRIFNNGDAVIVQADGSTRRVLSNNAVFWKPTHLPSLSILSTIQQTNVDVEPDQVSKDDLKSLQSALPTFTNTQSLVAGRLFSVLGTSEYDANETKQFSSVRFLIDATTKTPIKISYILTPENLSSPDMLVELYYQDYHATPAGMVPFTQRTYRNGILYSVLQVRSVSITSVPDSAFVLPEVK